MLKVILVLVILGNGAPPKQAQLEQPDIETCVANLGRFLQSEYLAADGVAGLQAGCVVLKAVEERDAKS